jgi:hypothetical protein
MLELDCKIILMGRRRSVKTSVDVGRMSGRTCVDVGRTCARSSADIGRTSGRTSVDKRTVGKTVAFQLPGGHTSDTSAVNPGFELIELGSILAEGETEDEITGVQDEGGAGGGLQLGFVAGVILRERLPAFEKMLWRACRGNVFLRQAEIEDPLEDPQAGDQVFKSVFVIFFQGEFSIKASFTPSSFVPLQVSSSSRG